MSYLFIISLQFPSSLFDEQSIMGREGIIISLCHLHLLWNNKTFICINASEIPFWYSKLQCVQLSDFYLIRLLFFGN